MNPLRALIFSFLATLATAADPQPGPNDPRLELADGRVLYPKQMRREKDTIIATLETPPASSAPVGTPVQRADVGFALKDIFRLVFPKPDVLNTAPGLIASGKAEAALAQLDPILKYYTGFRDAPGSWWVDAVPLQIQALLALKRDKEAVDIAESFARLASDEEIKKLSLAFTAVARTRKGEHESALSLYDEAAKATKRIDILGLIAVNRGDSLVAIGDVLKAKGELGKSAVRYEEALLSYLRIPALYPGQRMYLPQATYGAARAYLGIEDFDRAMVSIKELRDNFAATAEAKLTDELEARVKKRREQLADPNKPAL